MSYYLDTSVVLRLLVNDPKALHEVALEFLDAAKAAGSQIFISDLVISETYFALQHHYAASKVDSIESLRLLFSEHEIRPSGHAGEVLKLPGLASSKPGFVDRLLHAEAIYSQCKWVTFEKSGAKLPHTVILKKSPSGKAKDSTKTHGDLLQSDKRWDAED